jgi:hypothetical protein
MSASTSASPSKSKSPEPSIETPATGHPAPDESPAAVAAATDNDDDDDNARSASDPAGSRPVSPSPVSHPVASDSALTGIATAGDWQAIWSPSHSAYYFFNATTQQTTWENPLEPPAPASAPASPVPDTEPVASSSRLSAAPPALAQLYALQEAAAAQGIDPALAYLDPSLGASAAASGAAYASQAKFNARTGTFTALDGRDPSHLSEYERARRMSSVYFDVGQWEADLAARKEEEDAEGGRKRKRPSKKDLVRLCLLVYLLPACFSTSRRLLTGRSPPSRNASRSRRSSRRSQRLRGCVHRPLPRCPVPMLKCYRVVHDLWRRACP